MLRSIILTGSLFLAALTSSAVEIAATLSIPTGNYNDEIRPVLFQNNIEMASADAVEVNLSAGVPEEVVFDSDFDAPLRNGEYTLCFVGSNGQLLGNGVNVTVENEAPLMNYTAAIDEVEADATEIMIGSGIVEVTSDINIKNVSIYSISGVQVISENVAANECAISTSDLANGMYIAQVTLANGNTVSKKFLNK